MVVLLAALLHAAAMAPRQSTQSSRDASAQPPVFRVATRLVQVSVVVHDRHGQPVADLKKEDFTLTERGKPQAINFFEVVAADRSAAPAEPLPPHVFTNIVAHQAGVPTNVTVILIDMLNTSLVDQHYARSALVKFLGQIQSQDRVALYALGHRSLTLLHDYTTDSASLVERLRNTSGEIPSQLDASTVDADSEEQLRALGLDGLADMSQMEADFFTTNRVVQTLSSLEAIAQHLAGVPGRKNLIWLSGGFPLTIGFDEVPQIGSTRDRRTFTQEMDAAMRALNHAAVSVYPVDARGLMIMPGFSADTRAAPPLSTGPRSRLAPIQENIDAMKEIADRTGGRAAYNTNDLSRAVRRAIDDARVTYIVGYYPTDETQDGKFREIRVKVDRPDLDVRYRKGYFAMRPVDTSDKTRKSEMRAAVWSPLESTAVGLTAKVELADGTAPDSVHVLLKIDPATIAFTKEGDRWKAELDVVYVQKVERGKPADGIADKMSLALTDATYAEVAKNGLVRERTFARQSGATALRIVVRDADTGSTGSITIPFDQATNSR